MYICFSFYTWNPNMVSKGISAIFMVLESNLTNRKVNYLLKITQMNILLFLFGFFLIISQYASSQVSINSDVSAGEGGSELNAMNETMQEEIDQLKIQSALLLELIKKTGTK